MNIKARMVVCVLLFLEAIVGSAQGNEKGSFCGLHKIEDRVQDGAGPDGCPSPKRRPTVRLAREHPRSAAKTLSLVGGRATANLRPAALHGHTGFARRTGSGRQSRTCEARSVVVRTGGAGLRRPADVAMKQATDFWNLHDPARLGELDGPDVRRILVEREVSASPVIVLEVASQDAA